MRVVLLIVAGLLLAHSAYPRDAARDLRKLIGFTIIAADSVDEVSETDGDKRVKLSNGMVFKVDSLFLDPLSLTDVIIFAKPLPPTLVNQYKGRLADRFLYTYKLLIDNEVFDATPQ